MNPATIVLLLVVSAWAAALYYFFMIRKWGDLFGQARAAIVILCSMLIPVLLIALWLQHSAKDMLRDIGLAVHTQIGSSVGMPFGVSTFGNSWVFEYNGDKGELLDFYRDVNNRSNWAVVSDSGFMLILAQGDRRLSISAEDGAAFFVLTVDADR